MFAELSNYLDERLDDSMCEQLEHHLEGCEACKAFLATLEATIKQLRSTPGEGPRRSVAEKVRRELLSKFPSAAS
jgi:anti-sigma factor RsiW